MVSQKFEPPGLLLLLVSVALAAALLAVTLGPPVAHRPGPLTQITAASDGRRDSERPSLDQTGSKIAFQSDADFLDQGLPDNQFEIWLYDRSTMTYTRITTASAGDRDSFDPSLSADGTMIAFRSNADFLDEGLPFGPPEIWLYDTTALTYTRLTGASAGDRVSFGPVLNAEGTKAAFVSDSDFFGQGVADNQFEIWLYDTQSMTLTRVTSAPGSEFDSFAPSFDAAGRKLAFQSNIDFTGPGSAGAQFDVWLYDTAAMTYTRIATTPPGRESFAPSLSADGVKVAFSSDFNFLGGPQPDNQYEIWLYDTRTMTYTRITTASSPERVSFDPSLSADGTRVAFMSDSDFLKQGLRAGQLEAWLYDTVAMTYTRLSTASDVERTSENVFLSPAGSQATFESNSDLLNEGVRSLRYNIWLYTIRN